VAVDPNPPSATPVEAAIENEIPTYRAISSLAILSLILGLIALFSLIESFFIGVAVLAVAAGLYADWKIRRLPDVLTGRTLAQAGVALGLIAGLGAVTLGYIQSFIRDREAAQFARQYAQILKNRSIAECLFYRLPPEARKDSSPEAAMDQFQKMSRRDPRMFQEQVRPMDELKKRLAKSSDSRVVFDQVEATAVEGFDTLARVRLKVEAPGDGTLGENYALLLLKGKPGRPYQWSLMRMDYPYVPGRKGGADPFPGTEPIGDGHGHGGHGH
jgi:hypothetical protein